MPYEIEALFPAIFTSLNPNQRDAVAPVLTEWAEGVQATATATAMAKADDLAVSLFGRRVDALTSSTLAAERARWLSVITEAAGTDRRLEFAARLLATSDMCAPDISAAMEFVPANSATTNPFFAAMTVCATGAPALAAEAETDPNGPPTAEKKAAFLATMGLDPAKKTLPGTGFGIRDLSAGVAAYASSVAPL
ncbi:hypothetical protein EYW49_16615 [Siculibacillus lacustris]|uniref:Uncharacterized protein n=1 Tax=Siculibacillus lacustris TaxID=1549641 RepID=A0A4Q9VIJ3_9HYPH|nr:hypothetical protein [Siculibacillus lacustris]TBW35072.1 hypothetical protein EYW49_16615 [Siculibacillus lacustris]